MGPASRKSKKCSRKTPRRPGLSAVGIFLTLDFSALMAESRPTTTTAGRMQAEKHREASSRRPSGLYKLH